MEKNFKTQFCSHYNCKDDEFERAALLKVIHRRSLPLAWFLLKLNPGLFKTDFQILRQIGSTANRNNLLAEARDIRNDYLRLNDFGVMRKLFNLRISGKRLLALGNEIYRGKTAPSPSPASAP